MDRWDIDIKNLHPKNTLGIHYKHLIKFLKTSENKFLKSSVKMPDISYTSLYLLTDNIDSETRDIISKNKNPRRCVSN